MQHPNVVLHDHLDGGLRVETVIELADLVGHTLPSTDPVELGAWFDQVESGSLETYLEAFDHTLAVMQTQDACRRVAAESLADLADDGAVHVESRFAPLLLTRHGLAPEAVIEAVLDGFSSAAREREVTWGLIVDAMRSDDNSLQAAELAVRYSEQGVVAFDLAGPERGYPPEAHLPAINHIREYGLGLTLHAGEAGGLASIASAVFRCGADRIGHGIEIAEDVSSEGAEAVLGGLARRVRDRRVPLEVCPTSNLATKGWSPEEHPLRDLHRWGFNVTLNTDNRLMSATSMSKEAEFALTSGLSLDDLARMTRNALAAAFCSEPQRRRHWEQRIAPWYAERGVSVDPRW
ncbi:MAG: adenosine deaminase [Acidimicrobiia bacterium]|nr:adenosine deaminase [Acidimicrobiia bacterium]MDH4306550.1 adenosine deaminase [Acidimicrobiia bacterium]